MMWTEHVAYIKDKSFGRKTWSKLITWKA